MRANNKGHGPLDFCHVKANFSARVPKNLGGPRPPQRVVSAHLKRGPRAKTRVILISRVFVIMTDHESEGSGAKNEALKRQNFVLFARSKMVSRNRGKICTWSNDAKDMLIAKSHRKLERYTTRYREGNILLEASILCNSFSH